MAGWNEPEHRLDSERLKEMFVSLDSQIGLRRDTAAAGKLDVLACGGAVMCFKIADRGTGDVDIMWPSLPPDVQHAARVVARRRGVDPNWFNDGPARVSRTARPPSPKSSTTANTCAYMHPTTTSCSA